MWPVLRAALVGFVGTIVAGLLVGLAIIGCVQAGFYAMQYLTPIIGEGPASMLIALVYFAGVVGLCAAAIARKQDAERRRVREVMSSTPYAEEYDDRNETQGD